MVFHVTHCMKTGIGFTEQSVCRQHRKMFAARGVGGQLGPGPFIVQRHDHGHLANIKKRLRCGRRCFRKSCAWWFQPKLRNTMQSTFVCWRVCSQQCFFLPSVETLVGQIACNRRMPHMYNRQLPLSLQGAVVSLVFPPFLYNRDSYKFETLAVMLVLFICSFPKGFCLPTGKWYSSTMKRSCVTSFRVEVVVVAWLITQFLKQSTSCASLFLCNVLSGNVVYSRMLCQFSIRTSVDHGCVSRHLLQLMVFCFFFSPTRPFGNQRDNKNGHFLVHVLHEWVANNLIIRGTFVLEPIPRLQP